MLVGDKVVKINGKSFTCTKDLLDLVKTENETPVIITIIRDGKEIEVAISFP
ncbi:MAG: PDZ domain-containing protein [Bacteroidetes bacterium]|nr:PDZ domain-containing protein [Bacteroidota bacterium]MCL1969218.1 PDZ domain-containing protein [Bacteroidota bacterium]